MTTEASQRAFEAAIAAGTFSADPDSPEYAGDWMYMGTEDGLDAFKNRNTRLYRCSARPARPPSFDQWPGTFTPADGCSTDD